MNIYFPADVEAVTTQVHDHRRRKGDDRSRPFVVECADERCLADLRRYGGAATLKEVRLTYDQQEELRQKQEDQGRFIPDLARAMAEAGMAKVAERA